MSSLHSMRSETVWDGTSSVNRFATRPPKVSETGFWILNVLRCVSVISLITTMVASVSTLIKTFIVTQFYFFDWINHFFLLTICIFLIFSEVSLLENWFNARWPLFARRSSLVWVGGTQIYIGFVLLSYLNKSFASKQSLGDAFNALLIAAGALVTLAGVLNFVCSFVFRADGGTISARMVRSISLRKHRRATKDLEAKGLGTGFDADAKLQVPERSYSVRKAPVMSTTSSVYSQTAAAKETKPESVDDMISRLYFE